jgi:hypothetical protein
MGSTWLTGQIINDYIDANRATMASRAYQSQAFNQKSFVPQDPPVLSDASLAGLIQSKALPDSAEAVTRWRSYTGTYEVKDWGRAGKLHEVGVKNGRLTLDGALLLIGLDEDLDQSLLEEPGPMTVIALLLASSVR